jgi:transcriptional regulator with XRE-family HTH domain
MRNPNPSKPAKSGREPTAAAQAQRNVLAANLLAARQEAGLTQAALASLSGVSRDFIGKMEKAAVNVSIDVLTKLAPHVRKSPVDLLTSAPIEGG